MGENLQSIAAENRLALWTERVSACRDRGSGKSVQMWCAENGVNCKAYYYWQHKIFGMVKGSHTPQFVEIPAVSKTSMGIPIAGITFGENKVEIYSGADEATLRALFRGLQQC
ncbi:MAG: hypothetical protein RR937_09730 [Ruthenibacterium sp.]